MTANTGHDELAQLRAELAEQRGQLARLLARQAPRRRLSRRLLPLALAALLVALVPLATLAANPFTDLAPNSPHNGNIDAIFNAGITTGCVPNKQYCPTDNVTRQEMASFLARTAGLGSNPPVANAKTAQTATNATTVGGLAPNGLVRVARGTGSLAGSELALTGTFQTVASVAITVPAAGFVLVNSSTTFENSAGASVVEYRLRNQTSTAVTSTLHYTGVGPAIVNDQTGASDSVFAVSAAGPQTFILEARIFSGAAGTLAFNGEITALYVPFGSTGAGTLGAPAPAVAAGADPDTGR